MRIDDCHAPERERPYIWDVMVQLWAKEQLAQIIKLINRSYKTFRTISKQWAVMRKRIMVRRDLRVSERERYTCVKEAESVTMRAMFNMSSDTLNGLQYRLFKRLQRVPSVKILEYKIYPFWRGSASQHAKKRARNKAWRAIICRGHRHKKQANITAKQR